MWAAASWGLAGGFCVEALELYARIRRGRRWSWRRPIPQGMVAFVVSVVIRVGMGAVVAAAAAGSRQVSGPLAAFTLGIAAPLVIEKLAHTVPLSVEAPDAMTAPSPVRRQFLGSKPGPGRSSVAKSMNPPPRSPSVEQMVEGVEDAR